MKVEESLKVIIHFFNDIIGAVIPGIFFIFGLIIIHRESFSLNLNEVLKNSNAWTILLLLALSYAVGHGLLSIYYQIFGKIFKSIRLIKGDRINDELPTQKSYQLFNKFIAIKLSSNPLIKDHPSETEWKVNDLRNIALTLSKEGASLSRRFMFIALLNQGIGTALFLLALDFLYCVQWDPTAISVYPYALHPWIQAFIMVALSSFFIRGGDEFYRRAMCTPFSVALSEILIKDVNEENS